MDADVRSELRERAGGALRPGSDDFHRPVGPIVRQPGDDRDAGGRIGGRRFDRLIVQGEPVAAVVIIHREGELISEGFRAAQRIVAVGKDAVDGKSAGGC